MAALAAAVTPVMAVVMTHLIAAARVVTVAIVVLSHLNPQSHRLLQVSDSGSLVELCFSLMSHRSLRELYCFSRCPCFFSNTYVLYTIRKGF